MKGIWALLLRTKWLSKPFGWVSWPLFWLTVVFLGCGLGALIGMVLFVSIGSAIGYPLTIGELALNGAKDGGFYALIWFPGIAFVLSAILANGRLAVQGRKDFNEKSGSREHTPSDKSC